MNRLDGSRVPIRNDEASQMVRILNTMTREDYASAQQKLCSLIRRYFRVEQGITSENATLHVGTLAMMRLYLVINQRVILAGIGVNLPLLADGRALAD